jgi:hypothetical protein
LLVEELETRLVPSRMLYAVNQSPDVGVGTISVYDIDNNHQLVSTYPTGVDAADVRGVCASAATGMLYFSYINSAGQGRICAFDLTSNTVTGDFGVATPAVDRLSISPDGMTLYVPGYEYDQGTDTINVVHLDTGAITLVPVAPGTHDIDVNPLTGLVYISSHADPAASNAGQFVYEMDPVTLAVTPLGPFTQGEVVLPFALTESTGYLAVCERYYWGMEVENLNTGEVVARPLPGVPPDSVVPHGIAWNPSETEVWESGGDGNPHAYVWDMTNPMDPRFSGQVDLQTDDPGTHWITFTIQGDYAYVSPPKGSTTPTQVFDAHTLQPVATIASSEDLLEVDFSDTDGTVTQVGDQYGIGRLPAQPGNLSAQPGDGQVTITWSAALGATSMLSIFD